MRGISPFTTLEQALRGAQDGTEWDRFLAEDEAWLRERDAQCVSWAEVGDLGTLPKF